MAKRIARLEKKNRFVILENGNECQILVLRIQPSSEIRRMYVNREKKNERGEDAPQNTARTGDGKIRGRENREGRDRGEAASSFSTRTKANNGDHNIRTVFGTIYMSIFWEIGAKILLHAPSLLHT